MSDTTISSSVASYAFVSGNVTLTNLGTIGSSAAAGVVATSAGDTVINAGTIRGKTFGLSASLGLAVTNSGAGADIYGGTDGVYVTGGGATIVNAASIGGAAFGLNLRAAAQVTNQSGGSISGYDAVTLAAGGTISNASGGTISATGAFGFGILVTGSGTVVNAGSIAGNSNFGVKLSNGGSFNNQAGGIVSGAQGVFADGGTLTNDGRILSSTLLAYHQGVDLYSGAILTNQADGTIAGFFGVATDGNASVVNAGQITGGGKGVQLFLGGMLTNQSGGTITGEIGAFASGTGSIDNAGSISGSDEGVYLIGATLTNEASGAISGEVLAESNATVMNAGHISASGVGLYATASTDVTNQSGGIILGGDGVELTAYGALTNDGSVGGSGIGVLISGAGAITNRADGTVSGTNAGVGVYGVANYFYYNGSFYRLGYQIATGSVTNAGLIQGAYGVRVRGEAATVVDSGTIIGSTEAVAFAAGYGGRLVLDPGASLNGVVLGNGASLELGSGFSTGTISNIGTHYTGFTQFTIDPGANWVFAGSNSFAAGATLIDDGTISAGGGLVGRFGPGGGNRLVLAPSAAVLGTIDGGNTIGAIAVSTLELTGGAAKGTLNGLGTTFVNFGDVSVDAGAYWLFTPNTFAHGVTLINDGTIGATSGTAVSFTAGSGNRVVLASGAAFLGTVDGGNTIGASASSVLELGGGATTGTLSGLGSRYTDFSQVTVDSGASWYLTGSFAAGMTLTNAGDLSGPGATVVSFGAGAANRVVFYAGGRFGGTVNGGNAIGSGFTSTLELATGNEYGSLYGIGTRYTNFAQITVDAGGYWGLTNTNLIAAGATLIDSGTLANDGTLQGNVTLAGGTMRNRSGATITGIVLGAAGAADTLANAGSIQGSGGTAVRLASGYANLVMLYPGAAFGGTVNAGAGTLGVLDLESGSTPGTLSGFGTSYVGFGQITIVPHASWNLSSDTLSAGVTLTNFGTALGSPDAVHFAAGAGNRLVVKPGATFSGTVDGGNTLGAVNASTLELTSYYFEQGTIGGLGTTFIDFAQISVDAAAHWLLTGTNSIASGVTLSVAGELGNSGALHGNVTLAGGTFYNYASGSIVNGAIIGVGAYASVGNYGTITTTGSVAISFTQGGIVRNRANAALISGATYGVAIAGAAGTVTNYGHITGTQEGVVLADGGRVSNLSAGHIIGGGAGVSLAAGGYIYNDSYGTISGTAGVVIGGGGSLTNVGHVLGTTASGGIGVSLQAGGSIFNEAGATVKGFTGVLDQGGAGTVRNVGVITGSGGTAVQLGAGFANRVIVYPHAVFSGVVNGNNTGASVLELATGIGTGTVSGFGSQYIGFGQITVDAGASWNLGSDTLTAGVTLTNAGTLHGTTDAVRFAAGGANRLVVDPGAAFYGNVDGGNTIGAGAVSTLELASAHVSGAISGLGSSYVDFAAIAIDPGADWTLTGGNTIATGVTLTADSATLNVAGTLVNDGAIQIDPSYAVIAGLTGSGTVTIAAGSYVDLQGTLGAGETIVFAGGDAGLRLDSPGSIAGTITGFAATDSIDLAGVNPASVTYSGGELRFTPSGGGTASFALSLGPGNTLLPASSDGEGGTELSALCFCAGTHILTPAGEVTVDRLAVGDLVVTADGVAEPIVWIGVGRVLATRGRRGAATPVIVRKGALGDGIPHRDLRVTKGHSLFLDQVLIPVEFLINHRSILWDDRAQEVEVYHIELARHGVLLAEGAPAESYRDDGNRWLFRNANEIWNRAAKPPCAQLLTGGGIVDAIWRRLLDRAGPRPGLPLSDDPDLHLVVDGVRIDAGARHGGAHIFTLAASARSVRVVSRSVVPEELGIARDARQLGVALRRIVVRRRTWFCEISAADPLLERGFHRFEPDAELRWTDGDAILPATLFEGFDGPIELMLHVGCTTRYPLEGDAATGMAA